MRQIIVTKIELWKNVALVVVKGQRPRFVPLNRIPKSVKSIISESPSRWSWQVEESLKEACRVYAMYLMYRAMCLIEGWSFEECKYSYKIEGINVEYYFYNDVHRMWQCIKTSLLERSFALNN